jgi:HD superfamily phosphohydrolase
VSETRFKLFSDPVHGFISVPKNLILDLVQTPEVQRLRRIRQMGVAHLVFPGAEHTRFVHALGAMALMQDALKNVNEKGTAISQDEYTAALAAALLHDIGHGAFSHTLEHELVQDFEHEDMSRLLLGDLNERFDGALDLAIKIFDDTYERPFFHELVASQLDMDRLDYLRRDSFYTGVAEGEVGVQRIIKTMRVHPTDGGEGSQIAIEGKGIYAVENFLLSRRLMYWQVYLHKTVLAGDQLLRAILRRVRWHAERGSDIPALDRGSDALLFFLRRDVHADDLHDADVRQRYCDIDDTDILFSLKQWMGASDPVLADLCRRFINRDFFRVTFLPQRPSAPQIEGWKENVAAWLVDTGVSDPSTARADAELYLTIDRSGHTAYERSHEMITILDRDGQMHELTEMADSTSLAGLEGPIIKPYVCYPKPVDLPLDAVPSS